MKKYFGLYLEFDKNKVDKRIDDAIDQNIKGYVCVVDGNVLATAYKRNEYKSIINAGLVNICDGSSIALMVSAIHKTNYEAYTGPDIFSKYVKRNYKQYFLGNTEENLVSLQKRLGKLGCNKENYKFMPLPFGSVEDFDYELIAGEIRLFSADIVWISLGAPKQEVFISKLITLLDKGVLFGIGAAFNFYVGDEKIKRAPKIMREFHLEWFYRLCQEPNKQFMKLFNYLSVIMKLILTELREKRNDKF
jgi:N-acetylglucosaminyldiphosphoundecaprenol N-acetyl-beta-D-mannosaminyltransferase